MPRAILMRCLLLAALAALPLVAWARGAPPTRDVKFDPLPGCEKLRSRSQAAQVTKDDTTELRERGFALLGVLSVEHVTERCDWGEKTEKECKPISQRHDPTTELLKEAADRGADLVVLHEDRAASERQTGGKRAYSSQTTTSYSSMVYYQGHYTPGLVTRTVPLYEKYLRSDKLLRSTATLFRHEPKLAEQQARADEFSRAVMGGEVAKVTKLLDEGVPVGSVDSADVPPLGWAAVGGDTRMVELLIARGASLDAVGSLGTPLHMAAQSGYVEMLAFLLKHGARIDQRDRLGNTPLLIAAGSGQTRAVGFLLDAGADPNPKNDLGFTPLFMAIMGFSKEQTKALQDAQAAEGRHVGDDLIAQDPEIVRLLLAKGADPAAVSKEMTTPISKAEEWAVGSRAARFFRNYWYGAYGYIDRSGRWVIKPEYLIARSFHEGRAAVSPKNLDGDLMFGFIDTTGAMVIPAHFTDVGDFHDGLARAQEEESKVGFIDRNGKWVIEPTFARALDFFEGLAPVRTDEVHWIYVDRTGHKALPETFDSAGSFRDGVARVVSGDQKGIIDKTGKWVVKIPHDTPYPYQFSEGLGTVKVPGKEACVGYMEPSGKFVIQPIFKDAADFSEGLARITGTKFMSTWKFIDRTGRIVLDAGYTDARSFSDGLAMTMTDWGALTSKHGKREVCYIDHQGKAVLTLDYLSNSKTGWDRGSCLHEKAAGARDFSEGLAPVRILEDKFLAVMSGKE